jgi:hypothetical protein
VQSTPSLRPPGKIAWSDVTSRPRGREIRFCLEIQNRSRYSSSSWEGRGGEVLGGLEGTKHQTTQSNGDADNAEASDPAERWKMSFLSREEGRREKVIHRLESPWGECVIETVPDGMPTFPLQLIVSHHILNELTRQLRNLQTSHRRREEGRPGR